MTVIEGEWIPAVNQASHVKGSIHDEERARELGFERAVVGAGMHIPMVTKAPVSLFEMQWYERGFLKARFGSPMHDGDMIRLVLEDVNPSPSDERLLSLRIEKRDGSTPLTGFLGLLANLGQPLAPWQREGEGPSLSKAAYDPLPSDPIGTMYLPKAMTFEPEESLRALTVVGDACPWYSQSSPWGPAILPTYRFVRIPRLASDLTPTPDAAEDMQSSMNALFQVLHLGPVLCGRTYSVQSTLVEKGYSGRTAFRTSEAVVSDGGRTVAMVRQMLRWIPQRALLLSA